MPPQPRPTRAELEAAAGRTIDDVIGPGLDILVVGINPGLWSGLTGHHFAKPGNRFWRAIAMAGLVDRVLLPSEQAELLDHARHGASCFHASDPQIGQHAPLEPRSAAISSPRVSSASTRSLVSR